MLKASKYEAGLKIRSPSRVVIDDDLDRPQVYGLRRPSRVVLMARDFPHVRVDIF